jgi:hypothetical protein
VGQEVAPSDFRSHRGVAQPENPCILKGNFPSHQLFLDPLLSGSDLKGRGFKEGEAESRMEKKPWCTEVLALPM